MPLLDGKYEIHGERAVGGGVTSFTATTPSGEAVRVEWLELAAEDEAAFERYRRALKRLTREGRAAIHDLVARPGARYVAWYLAPEGSAPARDPLIESVLRTAGLDPAAADVRRAGGAARLFALPFRAPAPALAPATPTPPRARRFPWPSLPAATPELRTWALATGLVAVSALLLLTGFLRRANDRVVVVPDVIGVAYEVAARQLHELGLRVEPKPVASDSEQAGAVLATDPAAGQTLRPGREVRLAVALPPGQLAPTDVPRLVGLGSSELAGEALERAGLALGRVVRVHLDAPAGVVLAQLPVAGTVLGRGEAVDLVVSLGPRPRRTFVPDLVGLELEDARALAAVAGFTTDQIVVERLQSEGAPRGTVLAQSLAPYRDVTLADAVLRLIVADGPPALEAAGLPVLGGLSEADARALAAGFEIEVVYVGDSGLPDGVIGQSLGPGARPVDGPLLLTVNARPLPVPRPRVEVQVRAPQPRELPYLWFIEPGIPLVLAEVTATTLEGDRHFVARTEVRGGGRVSGTWSTTYPGVVRFDLTLNGEPYGVPLRVP